MDNILVTTGWHSDSERWKQYEHNHRSKLTFHPRWLSDYWIPQIEQFIDPHYFFYISDCEIKPYLKLCDNINILISTKDQKKADHRADFHSAIMNGMQFALTEGLHFCFIEQDCFCHNLDKIIDWSLKNTDKKNNKFLAYGFGKYSFIQGWAEQSLIFVPNDCIEFVLDTLNKSRIHETFGSPMPEQIWHKLFERYAVFFPFGYGRKPVDNWDKNGIFYKQQLTDFEIQKFIELRNKEVIL
jgi:hypothetical protein